MSVHLPHTNELTADSLRLLAELHGDPRLERVLAAARDRTGKALRTDEGVGLYRAQGAAAFLDELEALMSDSHGLLTRR